MEGCGSASSVDWDETEEANTCAKEGADGERTGGAVSLGDCRRKAGAGAAGEANSACQSNGMAASRLNSRCRTKICCEKQACEEEEEELMVIAEKGHETLAEPPIQSCYDKLSSKIFPSLHSEGELTITTSSSHVC